MNRSKGGDRVLDLHRLVAEHAAESEHLEFKAAYWTGRPDKGREAAEEAAKDVAALLNALGGTIVVGVAEDGAGQATAFVDVPDVAKRRSSLIDALRARLVPSSAADYVEVSEVRVEDKNLLVVQVRAWPHGVVAVRWSNDGGVLRFPLRVDRQTVDMAWEDVIMRNDAARRRTYLTLTDCVGERSGVRVWIGSAMEVLQDGRRVRIEPPPLVSVARVAEVHHDRLVLQMTCTNAIHIFMRTAVNELRESIRKSDEAGGLVAFFAPALLHGVEGGLWNATDGLVFDVPLDLIRSAWRMKRDDGLHLGLALDAACVFDGRAWRLSIG